MLYEVLTLSTKTTFLDTVLYLEDSTEQVPYTPFAPGTEQALCFHYRYLE